MGNYASSDHPQCSVREIFRKLKCVVVCCGGKLYIENSEIDGPTKKSIEEYSEETENTN
tara:strand:+ start:1668 stop:1844 length:177 start_codon:yes stop_codon:yes gene_type:complete